MTRHLHDQPLSERDEPCRGCGDPLFVCPATIRRYVRCCGSCTHLTDHDRIWHLSPEPINRVPDSNPEPTTPALLEAS